MVDLLAELDAACGVKTAGGAGDLLKAVGRVAAPAGRAASGYVSRLAGYGPRGPLQGQKLFDSSTVPVPLVRAEPRPPIELPWAKALDPAADRVARLPVPGSGVLAAALVPPRRLQDPRNLLDSLGNVRRQALYAADRQPLLHPVVQAARTVGHVLGTPVTVPPLRAAADAASAAGRTRLSTVLEAAAETHQLAGRAMFYGGAAAATAAGQQWARNRPAKQIANVVRAANGPTHVDGNPEVVAAAADPKAVYHELSDDQTGLSDVALRAGLRALPQALRNEAADFVSPPNPDLFDRIQLVARRLTVGGNLAVEGARAAADPTRPPVEDYLQEELAKVLAADPAAAVRMREGPLGQRLLRAIEYRPSEDGVPAPRTPAQRVLFPDPREELTRLFGPAATYTR